MRDFQTKTNVGALPDSNSGTKLGGSEVTSLRTEAKTAVSRAGLTLAPQDGTGEDTTQLAQAMFINGVGASTFQAGGTANAITLTPVTGSAGLLLPPDYSTLDGMQGSFFAALTNTGATTASVGQTGGTQFGTKKFLDEAGADLVGGEIVAGSRIDWIYDASADSATGAFILRQVATFTGSITLGTPVASTSGTLIDYLNIPSGTKRITINFSDFSKSGTSHPIVQLGDAGGVETTGYDGESTYVQSSGTIDSLFTTGFGLQLNVGSNVYNGTIILTLLDESTNTWIASNGGGTTDLDAAVLTNGTKDLSAELDRIRITTVGGTDTFDGGKVNITIEG